MNIKKLTTSTTNTTNEGRRMNGRRGKKRRHLKTVRKSGTEILEKEFGKLTFADLLISHRKAWDYSQKELAKMLGITTGSLCDLEKGRRIPTAKRAWNIASILGMYEPLWVQTALQDQLREQKLDLKVSIA